MDIERCKHRVVVHAGPESSPIVPQVEKESSLSLNMPTRGRGQDSMDEMKEQFLAYLRERGEPIPVSEIVDFLVSHSFADEVNVVATRRAFMRKVTGDPRFLFVGDTRARVVTFNQDFLDTGQQREDANRILEILLKKTILDGWDMRMHLDALPTPREKSGIQLLLTDGVVTQTSNGTVSWTKRGFIGYEPESKRASSLNLPERTWASVGEIITLLHLLSVQRELVDDVRGIDNHPMVHAMLAKGPPLTKSEAVEVTIEHLRCTLQRIVHEKPTSGDIRPEKHRPTTSNADA